MKIYVNIDNMNKKVSKYTYFCKLKHYVGKWVMIVDANGKTVYPNEGYTGYNPNRIIPHGDFLYGFKFTSHWEGMPYMDENEAGSGGLYATKTDHRCTVSECIDDLVKASEFSEAYLITKIEKVEDGLIISKYSPTFQCGTWEDIPWCLLRLLEIIGGGPLVDVRHLDILPGEGANNMFRIKRNSAYPADKPSGWRAVIT